MTQEKMTISEVQQLFSNGWTIVDMMLNTGKNAFEGDRIIETEHYIISIKKEKKTF